MDVSNSDVDHPEMKKYTMVEVHAFMEDCGKWWSRADRDKKIPILWMFAVFSSKRNQGLGIELGSSDEHLGHKTMNLPVTSSPFCCRGSSSSSQVESSSLLSPVMTNLALVNSYTSLSPDDRSRAPAATVCLSQSSLSVSAGSATSVTIGDSKADNGLIDFKLDFSAPINPNSISLNNQSSSKTCDSGSDNINRSFFKASEEHPSFFCQEEELRDSAGGELTIAKHKNQNILKAAGSQNTSNDPSTKNQGHYSNGEESDWTLNDLKYESGTKASEKCIEGLTMDEFQPAVHMSVQPTLEDLPKEVLLNIVQRLPTVSLVACATAHEIFAGLINDIQFLNMHTRSVLGFKASEKDITYDVIPAPMTPLQDLWFQLYLYRAAPNMVGLVRPGVIFYDLLCFKHLLDTFILQGIGYKHWMFVSDVLKNTKPPPLSFMRCKRLVLVSRCMLQMLTKVAICCQEILLLTVNNFEELNISAFPPSHLDDAWESGIPAELKTQNKPDNTCEVVTRKHGLTLASFLFAFDSKFFIGWSGVIDYSTFRWKDTWSLCKFQPNATLDEIKQICDNFFQKFIEYVGTEYVSIHCTNALLLRGLIKLTQHREIILPKVQDTLEKTALRIHSKVTKAVSIEECKQLKIFLDGVQFMGSDQNLGSTSCQRKPQPRDSSKTLEVALQRYLHRYLNQMLGRQVLHLYTDPICHRVLCINCRNTHNINPSPFCVERVGPQRIPLKIWPPHLMHFAVLVIPALAKLVTLDIELWRRNLLSEPLSEKVTIFVMQVLNAAHFDFNLDPCRIGVIAKRVLM